MRRRNPGRPRQQATSRRRRWWFYARLLTALVIAAVWLHREWERPGPRGNGNVARTIHVLVPVDPRDVSVDDGDTVRIRWPNAPNERVRILGIDAPEKNQEYGEASRNFARRWLLNARRLELLRAARQDRYGRTLGYLFVDGENFSVLAIENHMAESTVDRFGDNGFPTEAARIREAASRVGPPPFESPRAFRDRAAARKAG